MKSKERLEELLYYATLGDDGSKPLVKLYAEQIKKDLEVLDILKKQIIFTEHTSHDYEFGIHKTIYSLSITTKGLDFEQFDKIKECLDNDK